jgi:hypothetical protein
MVPPPDAPMVDPALEDPTARQVESASMVPPPDAPTVDPALEDPTARQEETATRADNAAIQVDLWNQRVWSGARIEPVVLENYINQHKHSVFLHKDDVATPCPLVVLRHLVLSMWQRNVYLDLKIHMLRTQGQNWVASLKATRVGNVVKDALSRVCRASFWEWQDGSSLIFWRWPQVHQEAACWGYPAWIQGELPRYRR